MQGLGQRVIRRRPARDLQLPRHLTAITRAPGGRSLYSDSLLTAIGVGVSEALPPESEVRDARTHASCLNAAGMV
jgi:hypothetical protein